MISRRLLNDRAQLTTRIGRDWRNKNPSSLIVTVDGDVNAFDRGIASEIEVKETQRQRWVKYVWRSDIRQVLDLCSDRDESNPRVNPRVLWFYWCDESV